MKEESVIISDSFIQLPEGQTLRQVMPYQVDHKKYPKWKFWRNQRVKYNFAVITDQGRFYIVDPDNRTIREKNIDNL